MDTLIFTQNLYNEKVSIGLRGYKPGGCVSTTYYNISFDEFQQARARFAPDTLAVCQGSPLKFANHSAVNPADAGDAKFSWDFGDGDTSHAWQPQHIYRQPGSYVVSLVYRTAYCSDTFTYPQPITVLDVNDLRNTTCSPTIPVLYVPNAFSPNGDGLNDTFTVACLGVESMHTEIYNRWGERVYSSADTGAGWDGRYKGAAPAEGVYHYRIQAQGYNGELRYYSGMLHLLK